jgi:hypothetical protein
MRVSYSAILTRDLPQCGWMKGAGSTPDSIVIFIAKGPFAIQSLTLKSGHDICVDGNNPVVFPGQEGQLAIMIELASDEPASMN